jgi:hypothetical protein
MLAAAVALGVGAGGFVATADAVGASSFAVVFPAAVTGLASEATGETVLVAVGTGTLIVVSDGVALAD